MGIHSMVSSYLGRMRNKIVTIFICFIVSFIIFNSLSFLDKVNRNNIETSLDLHLEDDSFGAMDKTVQAIRAICDICGELCDTTKEITQGDFMGAVTSKVDCNTLFKSSVFHMPALLPPQSLSNLTAELRGMYSYQGRVELHDWYWNAAGDGGGWSAEPTIFTQEEVQHYIDAVVSGTPIDTYHNGSNMVSAAADFINVTDKTVLVIGTQRPWLEAVLLSKNPRKVVTLEYGHYISEYPGFSFIRPDEFQAKFIAGTLDTFDAIFSFSSIEHSGLGRYGDTLNPWGDIIAIAEAWCVSSKDASLALSVPTSVSFADGPGRDIIE